MASFRGHLATSAMLGLAYGAGGLFYLGLRGWIGLLGAGLAAVAGLLPDLDSDSSVPHRTLFRLSAVLACLLALHNGLASAYPLEKVVLFCALSFVVVRYVLAFLFQRLTVHRGMFHSIPAAGIAGLGLYLFYFHLDRKLRFFLAGAVMAGYLSHLVLDEVCAFDFQGGRIRKKAATALKFFSPSWVATTLCYFLLFSLALLAILEK